MTRFKKLTHVLAVGFAAVVGFAVSPAGEAIVKQYPKVSGIFALLGVLGALYHSPKEPAS